MPVAIELTQDVGQGEIKLSYDSLAAGFRLTLTDEEGEDLNVTNVNLEQLEEFLFKAKRVVYFARYEEMITNQDPEDDDD